MTTGEAYESAAAHKPSVIYLTGKTCTGKTTFAGRLRASVGYEVVRLDDIVHDAIIVPLNLQKIEGDVFVSVYKTADNPEWRELFVAKVREHIQNLLAQGKKIIVDGAIANVTVVHDIFQDLPDTVCIYFHPGKSSPTYVRNLTNRFMGTTAQHRNGLPNAFWKLVDPEAFAQFCKDKIMTPPLERTIATYAEHSHQESKKRLVAFQQTFPSLWVVEV